MNITGQSIAVLGLGSSGEAATRLLLREGAVVTLLDSGNPDALAQKAAVLAIAGARVLTGSDATDDTTEYAMAVISPGIDPKVALVQGITARGIPLISEIELAYTFCKCPVIAITGTNGKTTTTGLIAAMLEGAGYKTRPGGNFGTPFSTLVMESPELDYVTLEVSSFQLEQIRTFRPVVSVWLNFAPDHLDRYPSVEKYRAAKLHIFDFQTAADTAVINAKETFSDLPCKSLSFSAFTEAADFTFSQDTIRFQDRDILNLDHTSLRGTHNAENLMAALGVAQALDIPFEKALPGLCAFQPIPHRCEPVGEFDGVLYLNDSKATNLDSLEKALLSQKAPVILIAGGKDKGFGFETLTALVAQHCKAAVLIGEMQNRIAQAWSLTTPCHKALSLEDAIAIVRSLTEPGDVVLFSPGTSSFDMFKNYEDRGDQFRTLVQHAPLHI